MYVLPSGSQNRSPLANATSIILAVTLCSAICSAACFVTSIPARKMGAARLVLALAVATVARAVRAALAAAIAWLVPAVSRSNECFASYGSGSGALSNFISMLAGFFITVVCKNHLSSDST
ncbi:MAG: hypothetical protein AMXMBFR61_04160 [Fimbriimonadales bacterium]